MVNAIPPNKTYGRALDNLVFAYEADSLREEFGKSANGKSKYDLKQLIDRFEGNVIGAAQNTRGNPIPPKGYAANYQHGQLEAGIDRIQKGYNQGAFENCYEGGALAAVKDHGGKLTEEYTGILKNVIDYTTLKKITDSEEFKKLSKKDQNNQVMEIVTDAILRSGLISELDINPEMAKGTDEEKDQYLTWSRFKQYDGLDAAGKEEYAKVAFAKNPAVNMDLSAPANGWGGAYRSHNEAYRRTFVTKLLKEGKQGYTIDVDKFTKAFGTLSNFKRMATVIKNVQKQAQNQP